CAGELDEAKEVLWFEFVARDESTRAHQPGEESFDAPASSVPPHLPHVLSLSPAARVVRRDHVHAVSGEFSVERIAVVRHVADQPVGGGLYEAVSQGVNDELALSSLTTRNPDGDRKTIAVCHCHDLGRFATSSDPNKSAPLL